MEIFRWKLKIDKRGEYFKWEGKRWNNERWEENGKSFWNFIIVNVTKFYESQGNFMKFWISFDGDDRMPFLCISNTIFFCTGCWYFVLQADFWIFWSLMSRVLSVGKFTWIYMCMWAEFEWFSKNNFDGFIISNMGELICGMNFLGWNGYNLIVYYRFFVVVVW